MHYCQLTINKFLSIRLSSIALGVSNDSFTIFPRYSENTLQREMEIEKPDYILGVQMNFFLLLLRRFHSIVIYVAITLMRLFYYVSNYSTLYFLVASLLSLLTN